MRLSAISPAVIRRLLFYCAVIRRFLHILCLMKAKYSPTYVSLIDLLFRLSCHADDKSVSGSRLIGGRYTKVPTGKTATRIRESIYISNVHLFNQCTPAEWHLIGRITTELKEYNALWKCAESIKNNSTNRKAIKGLIEKEVLIKTETTDIYLVNPVHIRRGDLFAVLTTTAIMLEGCAKVSEADIRDKRQIGEADFTQARIHLGY